MKVGETLGNIIESDTVVKQFIDDMKSVLKSKNFNCERDLDVLLSKKTDSTNAGYTTLETMAVLGYGKEDICKELLTLSVADYTYTVVDNLNSSLPKFYAFGKHIQIREVYIKVKIRDIANHKLFCVSFHFAKYPITKPYHI